MKRIGGIGRKTRYKYKKEPGTKGKISMRRYFRDFSVGDKVQLITESSLNRGTFHPRFFGKTGTIEGKKGTCYEVLIKDHKKEKSLIIHPVHLKLGIKNA